MYVVISPPLVTSCHAHFKSHGIALVLICFMNAEIKTVPNFGQLDQIFLVP